LWKLTKNPESRRANMGTRGREESREERKRASKGGRI
jgi:hypothetical protein